MTKKIFCVGLLRPNSYDCYQYFNWSVLNMTVIKSSVTVNFHYNTAEVRLQHYSQRLPMKELCALKDRNSGFACLIPFSIRERENIINKTSRPYFTASFETRRFVKIQKLKDLYHYDHGLPQGQTIICTEK